MRSAIKTSHANRCFRLRGHAGAPTAAGLLLALLAAHAAAAPITLPPQKGFTFRYDGTANRNTVAGAANRSFLSSGLKTAHEFSAGFGTTLTRGVGMDLSFEGRSTNDPLVTAKLSEITKYMMRITAQDRFSVDLGNRVFANFSQYALNRSVEGIQLITALPTLRGNALQLSLVTGQTVTPVNGATFSRRVTGVRLEDAVSQGPTVGINYAKTYDDVGSIATAGALAAASNDLTSVDGSWSGQLFGRQPLTLRGEIGLSFADTNTRDAAAGATSKGLRMDAGTQVGRWSVQGFFEKTGAGFQSLSGSAASDRNLYRLDTRGDLTPHLSVNVSYENSKDNVSGTKTTTTTVQSPRVNLSLTPSLSFRDLVIDLGYQLRNQRADNGSRNEQRDFANLGVRHRIGRLRFQLGLDATVNRDAVNGANGLHSGGTSLTVNPADPLVFRGGIVSLMPSLSWRTSQDRQPGTTATSTNTSWQFSLSSSVQNLGSAQLSYQLTDASRTTGQGSNLGALSLDLTYQFPPSLGGLQAATLSLRTKGFQDSVTTQNFSETSVLARIGYQL